MPRRVRGSLQREPHQLQNTVTVFPKVDVPKTDYAKPAAFKESGAGQVFGNGSRFRVLTAIKFNHEFLLEADKIANV
jgi:hypothetical protein